MVIANFKNDSHPIVYGASQWNYGEVLRIQGLNLPKAVEIHFSLEKTAGQAIPRIGTTKDGVTDVVIPDSLLENEGELQDYFVYVWIYLTDATSGRTEHSLSIKVKARSKPEIPGGDDNADPFREAIEEVNNAADRAETAEKQAGEYAEQTKADAIKTGEDRTAIAEMVESVSGIGEQVQAVKEYKEQAQTAATNALLSEQKSEQAKEAAVQAQGRTETVADEVEQHALEVAGDKAEVERLATQVRQDKSSVEQAVQGVGNTAQQAEQSINTAKTKAVEAVNATKTDAVKAVQTEGTKQTEAVQVKGQEVINSIPSDFTTQMQSKIDKQQGAENAGKSLVIGDDGNVVPGEPTQQIEVDKTLTQEGQAADAKATGDKILQYAIKNTASGEGILRITDSAEEKPLDFAMQGKTEQASTEGKNLFDANGIDATRHILGDLSGFSDIDVGSYNLSNLIPVKEGENIVKSGTTGSSVVGFLGEDKSFLKGVSITDGKPVAVPAGAFYFCCNIAVANLKNKIQIEKGNTATPYEPYTGAKPSPSPAYPQEITSAGKLNADTGKYEVNVQVSSGNIFDVDAVRNENGYLNSDIQTALDTNRFDIVEGRQYLLISKGSTLMDGTGYSTPYFGEDDLRYGLNHLNILGTNPGYQMFTKNERRKVILKAKKSTTITKFIVHGYNRVNNAYEVEEMGLFETSNNNTNIDYVPYKGLQKVQFQLDRPLTKWDRLEKREGVWGIARQSVREELTQYNFDTYILPSGSYPTGVYCYATKKSNAVLENQSSFCTHFKNSNYAYSITNAKVGIYSDHGKVQYKYFVSDKPTVDEFKAWLVQQKEAGTPVELVYKTAEETWEPLPEEMQSVLNALHTNYPTTIISNSEDTEMQLTYVADTKNYTDRKIEEAVTAQVQNLANLLSLMPLSTQAAMIEADTNNILDMEVQK